MTQIPRGPDGPEQSLGSIEPLVVVMGISGSGKTTVGMALAERLRVWFMDGDDLHPLANVEKMRVGHALVDRRRAGLVVVCSALKRSYRDAIVAEVPDSSLRALDCVT